MELLPLDSTYRGWLISKAALAFDSELNEKFIGLTHDESVFFAEMCKSPMVPLELRDTDKLEHFLQLHLRHELMLVSSAIHIASRHGTEN
jgi:hypothetical protein